jgi:hypothetical protein
MLLIWKQVLWKGLSIYNVTISIHLSIWI